MSTDPKPQFHTMTERQKFRWLMDRCHKVWVLSRQNGTSTAVCDLTLPNGQYQQFETTMPDRQSAIVHACERVYALRHGTYSTMSLDDMLDTLARARKWF